MRGVAQALVLLLAAAGGAGAAATPGAAELLVEAPPGLAAAAARIERLESERLLQLMRFVGLDRPGGPIRVVLEPAGSEIDKTTPPWVAGFAYGSLGTVVLFPERAPPYPYGSFDELVLHELAHVFAARAAGFQELPRWFSEGLAMVAAGSWGIDDRGWLTLAAVVDPETPIAGLEQMFEGGRGRRARAYALAGAFVRDLQQHKGPDTVAEILSRRRLGLPFDEAFRRTVGADPETAASAFWRRYSVWYRWVPLLTSSLTLWLGITGLALWAAVRKRRRRELIEAMWEEEDADRQPPPWVH